MFRHILPHLIFVLPETSKLQYIGLLGGEGCVRGFAALCVCVCVCVLGGLPLCVCEGVCLSVCVRGFASLCVCVPGGLPLCVC